MLPAERQSSPAPTPPPVPAATRAAPPRRRRRTRRRPKLAQRIKQWRKRAARVWRLFRRAPPALQTMTVLLAALALFAVANLGYQLARKPTEMLFPVSGSLNKPPSETWRQYGELFRQYATAHISPELLAALAQSETSGNPIARTYWRWRLTWEPFAIYKPASSAVGLYQMTDPAFAEARRYCIRHHVVVEAGPWDDWGSCWFTGLYTRVLPSHSIQLAAAFLERKVASILKRHPKAAPSAQQAEDLAVVVHLCGATPGTAFARRGFRAEAGERCGDHDLSAYLGKVNALKRQFAKLATGR